MWFLCLREDWVKERENYNCEWVGIGESVCFVRGLVPRPSAPGERKAEVLAMVDVR